MENTIIISAQQIIDIIEPIPSEQFIPYTYGDDIGRCCFIGHINKHISGDPFKDWEGFGARKLTAKFLAEHNLLDEWGESVDGANVNNEQTINGYNEPEIKDRVLHLLYDMRAAGY